MIWYLHFTFEQYVQMVFMGIDVPSVAMPTVKPVTIPVDFVTVIVRLAG